VESKQPEINIGVIGHIAHGKSTLVYALTKKRTQTHSEELKRGITIRLGYAEFSVYKCKDHGYTTDKVCPVCKKKCEFVRKISFVDAPGHETLMATMLAGASIIDGAILVIAANEPCPQPQTREHLMAIEISGIKNIVIVQNKIDLVSKEQALENYKQIKEFVKGTVAENAPIIPVSAQYGTNIDLLLKAMEENIPTPKRDENATPLFLTVRTFDVNKPGTDVMKLVGGVFGGSIIKGKLSVGDEIEIVPGIKKIKQNKEVWEPLVTKIKAIYSGNTPLDEARPGGNIALSTGLDPSLTKSDSLAGSVISLKGKTPEVYHELTLEAHLLSRSVGTKEELNQEPFKTNEPLLLNVWTSKTLGVVKKVVGNKLELVLKLPVAVNKGEKVAISRRLGTKWRLVGYGIVL